MSIPTDRLREIANPVYVPCVGQDEAIAIATELLACRATLDDVCKALGADVDSAVAQALMFKEKAGELAAVKRQRDELLARLPKDDEFPSWDELAMRPEIDERFGTRVRILNAAARERHEDPDLSVRKFVFEASRLHVRNLGAACAELLKAAVENWRAEQPKPQQPEVQP